MIAVEYLRTIVAGLAARAWRILQGRPCRCEWCRAHAAHIRRSERAYADEVASVAEAWRPIGVTAGGDVFAAPASAEAERLITTGDINAGVTRVDVGPGVVMYTAERESIIATLDEARQRRGV